MRMGIEDKTVGAEATGSRAVRRPPPSLAALLPLVVLASCAPRGVEVPPPLTVPPAFSAPGQAAMPAKWWTALGDEQLNAIIERALRGNFSLRMAWDRLDQARALATRSGAGIWPSLDGSAGASRAVRSLEGGGRLYGTEFGLGLVASYEVDLWGRIRSTHDAARLDVYASGEDLGAAAITLTADVARTWCLLTEQRGQWKLLSEQIETNEKYLEVVTLKFRRGQVSAADVLQQRQLVESARGERIAVASNIRVLQHQLDVLLGQPPGGGAAGAAEELPTLPPLPQTGLPAEWVRRRPDVRAAELRVQAADRRVAAAIADQFPRLGLSITADTSAERVRDLFDNWMASLAANLVAPLFDAGWRRAEVERSRAAVSERLNAYGQVVLASLREVEDALSREARQTEYVASLRKQLELSKQATDQTLENYTKRGMDFTRYLTTLLAHQRLQRTHLQARRQRVDYRIDLYRALAGSWALSRPPRAEVSGPREPVEDPAVRERNAPAPEAGPEKP